MAAGSSRRKRIFFTVLLYLGFFLVLEGLGQLVIRQLDDEVSAGLVADQILNHEEPVLGFGLKKGVVEQAGSWSIQTNSLGFRSQEFPAQKPEDELRLFVVGGSTVFGWGVAQDATIPARLQARVNAQLRTLPDAAGRRVRVINAGVPYYASWHEAALIQFRLLPLGADWIVVLDGLNDAANAVMPEWSPIHLGYVDEATRVAARKRTGAGGIGHTLLELLRASPTLRWIQGRWLRGAALPSPGVYRPEAWEQYARLLGGAARVAEASGVRFAVLLQPVIAVARDPLPQEFGGSPLAYEEFGAVFRRLYLEGVRSLEHTRDFPFQSLHALFRDAPGRMYLDGIHYTEAGSRLLADAIFEREILTHLGAMLSARRRAPDVGGGPPGRAGLP